MTTPLATIADALIEFILSLLRDPAAAAQFAAEPEEMLSGAGLSNLCAADVRSVVPVVVDRPDVIQRPVLSQATPVYPAYSPSGQVYPAVQVPQVQQTATTAIEEITNVTNNFAIDARSTIIDQSVNQNIWAEGDVTQIFDQEANVATGDGAIAAGDNVLIDDSVTDITTGDVNVGNTDITNDITDSFNDSSTTVDVDVAVNPPADLAIAPDAANVFSPDPSVTEPAVTEPALDPIVDDLSLVDPGAATATTEYEDVGTVLYDPVGYDTDGLSDQ